MLQDTETIWLKWVSNQDLIQAGATLERLRVLSTLGVCDTWPEAEQACAERVLDVYANTLACLNHEAQAVDEAAQMRAQIDSNLALIIDFLASDPPYLREPEFSALLLKTVLGSLARAIEQHREVGH